MTFALRLQRASLLGWAFALFITGAVYGSITQPLVEAFEDLPAEMIDVMGGDPSRMLEGYVSTMALFDAVLVGIFVILGMQFLRGEETKGRAEPVLATATSRWAWSGGYLAVLAAGVVGLLLLVGLVLGTTTAISVGESAYIWDTTAAHLVYAPALWVVIAVAALLFGVLPRAVGATWALLGFMMIVGWFGPIMNLPQWVHNLSPLEHVARLPLEELTWPPLIILTVIAVALTAMGMSAFRRRDLATK